MKGGNIHPMTNIDGLPEIGTTVTFLEYDYRGTPAGTLSGEVIDYVGTHTMRIQAQVSAGRQVFRRSLVQLVPDKEMSR